MSDHNIDLQNIRDLRKSHFNAFQHGDMETLLSHFTEETLLVNAAGETVQGFDALHDYHAASLTNFHAAIQDNAFDLEVSGDLGFCRGEYTITLTAKTGDQVIAKSGSFLVIFKRKTDSPHGWFIYRELMRPND